MFNNWFYFDLVQRRGARKKRSVFVAACVKYLLNLLVSKTPILQEASLLGALLKTLRRAIPEFPPPHPLDLFEPIFTSHIHRAIDRLGFQSFLLQLLANPDRPITTPSAAPYYRLGEALIGEQALRDQCAYYLLRDVRRASLALQLRRYFAPTVFTPGEPPDNQLPRLRGIDCGWLFAQASTSSGTASAVSAPATGAMTDFSRIRRSISAAASVCSFR